MPRIGGGNIGGGTGGGTTLASSTLNLGNVTGNVTLDVSAASVFVATITGATTFTFVNWPPGAVAPEPTVIARQDNVGHTISFAGITWLPVGTSPVFQVGANQTNVTTFFSTDNGVTVYGQGGSLSGGGYAVYGDGTDGVVNIDGSALTSFLGRSGATYFLVRDVNIDTLNIAAGYSLQTGATGKPYKLRVKNTLTIGSGAFLTSAGGSGGLSGGTGGKNGTGGTLAGGADGPDGTTGAGAAGTNVLGVNGGFAGRGGRANGSATGGGVNGIASTPASGLPRAFPEVAYMAIQTPTGTTWIGGGASGGAGDGDGTNAGGGGGRGGNPLWVAARNIANDGAMQAAGGAGGNSTGGNAGGGGGGQGGPIIYIYSTYAGSGVVLSLGGAGGTGTGTGTGGASGGPGWIAPLAN
jgi:hypothetical protein